MIQEPIQPTPEPNPPPRRAASRRYRNGIIGLVVVAAIALAVPVVGSFAAVTSGIPTAAVGASAAPSSSADTEEKDDDQRKGPKSDNGRGLGLGFLKGNGHVGRGPITITAINGSNLALATDDGWTRTIAVTSTTVITKADKTIGVADLKVKDHIGLRQTKNADGSFTVVAIDVILPGVGGTVSGKTADSITVTLPGGTTATIHVSSATTYKVKDQTTGALSDIAVGDRVGAVGELRADGSLDAVVVAEGRGPKIKGPKDVHPDGSDDPNEPDEASPAPS